MTNACKIHRRAQRGFSLLEVLVAIALLSISFISLALVQARNTNLAILGRNISRATGLARYQLAECKREVADRISSVSDYSSQGDFSELGFAGYSWECHAPRFNMKPPSSSAVTEKSKEVASGMQGKNPKNDSGAGSAIASPFISMITDTLGHSVRELAVIVRFKDGKIEDEVRVVTHVIDVTAMVGLSRMLSQGADTLGKQLPGKPPGAPQKEEGRRAPQNP